MSNVISVDFKSKQVLCPNAPKMRWSKDEIQEVYDTETDYTKYNLQDVYDYDTYWCFYNFGDDIQ